MVVEAGSRTSRWLRCRRSWPSTGSPSAAPRSGGSSVAARSRSKKSAHAVEQSRPDILSRRSWSKSQLDLDPARLVFLDETWAITKMARRQRLSASVPHGHWKTTTFIGGLRMTGMTAPMVLDGPMTARGPGLCRADPGPALAPGEIVVLDNLAAHKNLAARAAIGADLPLIFHPARTRVSALVTPIGAG